ncbi:hypothetical protein COS31_01290 [Candidatus Roizmanbacteria bacterium CG02_land_8_20_14_3_00_36_15]|uniref:Hydrolase TatD n=2 Tax=Candidatus Roizmaniibacteriota TaxID=1752723 RepID=A0A2M8KKF5_9BACT|nr:MAG: hypothetical protein COS51_00795 [Candidatus Roizmanbacteria bacterium CG03_land_8_20_14_0_80_36_21]PIV38081.1 MAG: hypothetical protein COS31_01290 [Candidatus Roizmanbacteria bacterium CG02_land_8_20_14_3_00_36_15]PIY70076.1 MAG: hypothetical protein COY89_03105 [Candidatus Roizmanbacteria bacterium CG_4_10_14_0_8_um_filter_36_36]PJC82029.1 MAG: hypothetical protein CO007_01645 [Candidatus Roizmanbacteria bacterium CG_4_8_14_3_um_filter_36_10]PJE60401.1 MAG: hypothetical protein COU86
MFFDTHCHLNFKAFVGRIEEVIKRAKETGVDRFVVPGTDVETSKKAVKLAEKYPEVYAAVGIHPHHVFQMFKAGPVGSFPPVNARLADRLPQDLRVAGSPSSSTTRLLNNIEELLTHRKVIAVGEVGLDKHNYQKTKYKNYQINDNFLDLQKTMFKEQIKLAIKYKKSLVIHNREAAGELLKIIGEPAVAQALARRAVFHCCEAEDRLLELALAHHIYIGVDGDVTYSKSKQEFVKKIPLELLVLETDSPLLVPEPLRSQEKYLRLCQDFGGQVNEPKNLVLIAEKIAELKKTSIKHLIKVTEDNSKELFQMG